MNTDTWATSKSTQLSTKVWVKLLLMRFRRHRVSYLNKADNYYGALDRLGHIMLQFFSASVSQNKYLILLHCVIIYAQVIPSLLVFVHY